LGRRGVPNRFSKSDFGNVGAQILGRYDDTSDDYFDDDGRYDVSDDEQHAVDDHERYEFDDHGRYNVDDDERHAVDDHERYEFDDHGRYNFYNDEHDQSAGSPQHHFGNLEYHVDWGERARGRFSSPLLHGSVERAPQREWRYLKGADSESERGDRDRLG